MRPCFVFLLVSGLLPLAMAETPVPPDAAAKPQVRAPQLKPGEFDWHPERSPAGPLLILVSRDDQLVYVYRNGIEIARSTVSTGKPGHGTPTGVFQILQKAKDHHSSIYKGAPMPYMQRLTWDGIALHAGNLPGYPASHGCVRLPYEFSQKLFGLTTKGATVVISSRHSAPKNSLAPYDIFKEAGRNLKAGGVIQSPGTDPVEGWFPEKKREGNLAIVVSSGDQVIHVLRDGVAIGRARFEFAGPDRTLPTGVFVMLDQETDEDSPIVKGRKHKAWANVALDKGSKAGEFWKNSSKMKVSETFLRVLYDELAPGALLIVTPEKLDGEKRSETDFVVLDAEQATAEPPPAPGGIPR